jgi:hypothetical protein
VHHVTSRLLNGSINSESNKPKFYQLNHPEDMHKRQTVKLTVVMDQCNLINVIY